MFDIAPNGIINLTRGDTFQMPIIINLGSQLEDNHYTLKDDDMLYFGLCEPNEPFEKAIVRKVFDKDSPKTETGDTILTFYTSDTSSLIPGKYYYVIKLRRILESMETVDTIVDRTLFYIWE